MHLMVMVYVICAHELEYFHFSFMLFIMSFSDIFSTDFIMTQVAN